MKKIFSVIILTAIIFFCGQNNFVNAQDIWLYTDRNGSEYYLRKCSLPARSWSFAYVLKVNGNEKTNLAYKFEIVGDVHYSVRYGNSPAVFTNSGSTIEKGTISDSPVAYKIWNDHLKQMEKERWERIRANESGGRR